MNGLIDIHSHILPLVDDGAESVEMALLMLKKAAEEGIEKIILTPHQKPDRRCVTPEGILRRMEELQELAGKEKNVLFGGRLGQYRYYDMDKVIRAALDMVRSELAAE